MLAAFVLATAWQPNEALTRFWRVRLRSSLSPLATTMAAPVPEGAESVLSKAVGPGDGDGPGAASRKKRRHNPDDETDELEKNFKF